MIKNILKRIGRLFITLDRQDVRTNWQDIKNILIISIPPEEHLWRALCIVTEKFKKADFKIILPDSKRTLVPDIVTRENVFGVKGKYYQDLCSQGYLVIERNDAKLNPTGGKTK